MKTIKRLFWNGLKAIVPVGITIAILVWILGSIEKAFGYFLKMLIPQYYFEGMGLIVCVILIFFVGWLLNIWLARKFHEWINALFKRIPLVKTLYTGLIDLMAFFDKSEGEKQMGYVVRVEHAGITMLGIVTRETFDDFPPNAMHDVVSVYLPMSYNIGGYTVFLPRSAITPIDMKGQDAIMFCITAGLKKIQQG